MLVSMIVDKFYISIDKTDKMILLGRLDDEYLEFKLWKFLDSCGGDLVRRFNGDCHITSTSFIKDFRLIIGKDFKDNVYIYLI